MPDPVKICPRCGREHNVVFAICGQCGTALPEQTVNEVVATWFESEPTMIDVVLDSPEVAWSAILQLVVQELTEDQIALLAAGPLEDLLANHGPQFIERVEREAENNPRFNYLLGGVWQNQMSQEIWQRVQKARRGVVKSIFMNGSRTNR